jgi:CPA1 family monovalent cation:H+ antiporter
VGNTTLNEVAVVVAILTLAIPLVALAKRANIAYPIVLVLAGLVLGFVPHLPHVTLAPDLVLVIFLPPLLYWESITAPTDVIRANAGQIWVLAIGLVTATTIVVAVVAHAAIPGLIWPMAFVLGAIVAPTDELASAPVLERMRMPRHLVAIVEGESLLNDASSLILYAAALTAATTGAFHFGRDVLNFVFSGVGGIVLGILAGIVAVRGWRWITDTQLQGVISFNLPYIAYILSQRFGLSGVLAVVYAGTYVNRFTPIVITAASRLQISGYWNTVVFLANALLFTLVGLQLHDLARDVLLEYSWPTVLWYAFLVNVAVIGTRFAWLMGQEFIPSIGAAYEHPDPDWKHALIASWSGLRGSVSLAAALAIPVTIASGAPLAHRHLVIFLTFSVILVTLVGGGLTLPLLIRALGVHEEAPEEESEFRRALTAMANAALARIEELVGENKITADAARRFRTRYEHKRDHARGHSQDEYDELDAEVLLIAAERTTLVDLRTRGEIDNTVLRSLQRDLDIAAERINSLR